MTESPRVQTVLDSVAAADLGVTLPHEHLFLDLRSPRLELDDPPLRERLSVARMADLDGVIGELADLWAAGGRTVVELTTVGMGRDVHQLQAAAHASRVHLVCATGFYAQEFHPEYVATASIEQLADEMVRELTTGIDRTTVRAGVIKLGSSCYPLTGNELKCFVAGAIAQTRTGVAITTHTSAKVSRALACGTMGFEQLDVFERFGVDPTRVIIGHTDANPNPASQVELARRGAYVEIDGIGSGRNCTDQDRARLVANLFEHGLGDRVLLSHDLARTTSFRSRGGGGYSYLLREFCPLLREVGLSDHDLQTLLVANPARVLGVPRHSA